MDKINSYTAANAMPAKVIQAHIRGKLFPLHIQLNPTNRCNRKCSFCSCSERDKKLELPLSEIKDILETFASMGTKAVSITGGGEPMIHKNINEIIEAARGAGIKVGLVTNGDLIERLKSDWPTWIRISCSDDKILEHDYLKDIYNAISIAPDAAWAWSYVVTRNPNWENMKCAIGFAIEQNFAHVRIVSDLLDIDAIPSMKVVKEHLGDIGKDERIIYQGRTIYTRGAKQCLISLLKPNIAADGIVYPCCGAQYALDKPTLDYAGVMSMGRWREFIRKVVYQKCFDGSVCVRCYYENYNSVLAACVSKLDHEDFV
jgi:MoaA/NifB/PqqE/SkfB family radical SAM enzyme